VRSFLRNNGLSIALFALFLVSIIGQMVTGWLALGEELQFHGLPPVGFSEYLTTGHFLSSTFENWESEFLQMSVYVLLTSVLVQKGSLESRKIDGPNPEDEVPDKEHAKPNAPWPVRRGGLILKLYSHSLSIAFISLFVLSFWLHLAGSTRRANEEAVRHDQPPTTMTENLGSPEFWQESFQNWQSEFFAIGVLVVLGIGLRQRGSPESKPVADPHSKTGH
jgi:hypothetical protein